MREIELQHTYGFSPTEAELYASKESGLSITEIADRYKVSSQTISNILHKARVKLENGDRKMEVLIIKVPYGSANYTIHTNAIEVIANFVANALNLKITEKNHTIRIEGLDGGKPGDVSWLMNNVFRWIDVLGTRNPEETRTRVNRLLNKLNEYPDKDGKVGYSILLKYLDDWFIHYDIY